MIYAIIAILVFSADLISKIIVSANLKPVGTIPLIKDVFHLTYVENRGIAFGMFSGGRWLFITVSVIVMVMLVLIVIKTNKKNRTVWLKAGASLVFSGAAGNLAERIVNGFVVDFLDFRLISFPVFNLADIAVCVGAAMMLIHFAFTEGDKREAPRHGG